MLLRFAVTNFASFRERQELSLVASTALKDTGQKGGSVRCPGFPQNVLTAAGIYGANASGKTRFLFALRAMSAAVADSHAKWSPREGIPSEIRTPYALHPSSKRQPTRFEADLVCEGVRYAYGFSVNDTRIVGEELWSFPSGRRKLLFQRTPHDDIRIGRELRGGRPSTKFVRPNSLFLSTAVQNNVEALRPVYAKFASLRLARDENDEGRFAYAISRLGESKRSSRVLTELLEAADLGIAGVVKEVRPVSTSVQERMRLANEALRRVLRKTPPIEVPKHEARLLFLHKSPVGGSIPLSHDQESAGTLMLVSLAFPVLEALDNGGLLLVDELDRSFHPRLVERILDLFISHNPRGAQLVFSSHASILLDKLRRDAIWFTEKRSDGVSRLFPLTDFHPRKDESVFRRYIEGRYGGLPSVTPLISKGRRGSLTYAA